MEINYKFIKERRKALKLTQEEVAERLNLCNSSHYCKIENGVYDLKAEMLPALSKILKCSITKFFA
jgi:transcriptional regulator with XRE-family HTH domain